MMFLPAIDLLKGQCVRLLQGEKDKATVYHDHPAEVAAGFERDGADGIHVVDLDGAFEGRQRNIESIRAVVEAVGLPVEVGGGIRTLGDIEHLFSAGVARVILGTAAVENPELLGEAVATFGAERVWAGIDARNGRAAIKGWVQDSGIPAVELGKRMRDLGVKTVIYTDIRRDGALTGPNINETRRMAVETGLSIIASGGVHSLKDIRDLMGIEKDGVAGIIAGRAIYEGTMTVEKAVRLLKHKETGVPE
ncbi:MAG: 1-(5-phosphoribosyl)-5-[(5-phosphoribosylamino)methylideneamino]imidazole-4-carboxamide isomerase [Fibrobacterota bacterium]